MLEKEILGFRRTIKVEDIKSDCNRDTLFQNPTLGGMSVESFRERPRDARRVFNGVSVPSLQDKTIKNFRGLSHSYFSLTFEDETVIL